MSLYYVAMLIAALGGVVYHLSLKKVPAGLNPFFSLAVAYAAALVICLVAMVLVPGGSKSFRDFSPSLLGVALGIVGIECGFLLAYRTGWSVGYAAISMNVLSALVLMPIAIFAFKEGLSVTKLVGAVLCIVGLVCLARK